MPDTLYWADYQPIPSYQQITSITVSIRYGSADSRHEAPIVVKNKNPTPISLSFMDRIISTRGKTSRRLFLFLFIAIFSVIPLIAEIPDPLRVALIPDIYPFSFIDDEGNPDGVFPLVIAEIARENQIEIEWVEGSWQDNLQRARDGNIDLMTSLIFTSERDTFLDYGSEVVISSWSQVFQSRERAIGTIFDLADKRIGLMKGDQNAAAFILFAQSFDLFFEIVEYDNFAEISRGLDIGDIDAGVFYSLYRLSDPELIPTNIIFQPNNALFAIPEGSDPEIIELIDETLEEWKKDHNSFYYTNIISLITPEDKSMPRWLLFFLIGLSVIFLLSVVFILILRAEVHARTSELLESQSAYRSTFVNAVVGIAHADRDGVLLRVNPSLCDFLGYDEKALIGIRFAEITFPEDVDNEILLYKDLVSGERDSYRIVKRYFTRDKDIVWAKISVSGVKDEQGELLYIVALVEDITSEKNAETRLGDLESRYLGMFQNSYQMTAILDELGRLVDVNETLKRGFNLTADLDELIGETMENMEWMGPVISLRLQEMVDECLSTGRTIKQSISTQETESNIALDITIKPVSNSQGSIRYCIVEAHNITELMELTENLERQVEQRTDEIRLAHDQLIKAEKMASLGRLVAGVAHEINTPVGVAKTGVTYLTEQVDNIRKGFTEETLTKDGFISSLDSIEDLTKILNENLDRAIKLINDFKLTSADQSSNEIRKTNVREYFTAVLHSITPRLKKAGIVWNIDVPDEQHFLHVGAVNPILLNLTMNAISHAFESEPGIIDISYRVIDGKCILLFTDDGKGIDESLIPRLFEPFYTTARPQGFTGLGLNIVYTLVKDILHGEISCESKLGTGTTFRIEYQESDSPSASIF